MKEETKSASMANAPFDPPPISKLSSATPGSNLRSILRQTICALTSLDAERLESMVLACECLSDTLTADDVKASLEEHRALELLLTETEINLKFLRRLDHQSESPDYRLAMTS